MISFENISVLGKIGVLDSYFIHRYIIIKYRSSSIYGKISQLFESYGPFFNFIFLQNACVQMRMTPGQGHLCHIDTFLVLMIAIDISKTDKFFCSA